MKQIASIRELASFEGNGHKRLTRLNSGKLDLSLGLARLSCSNTCYGMPQL